MPSTEHLRRKRRVLLGRMRGRCTYCGRKMRHEVSTLDHIVPRARGGRSNWENLAVSCARCNTQKADRVFATLAEAISTLARERMTCR